MRLTIIGEEDSPLAQDEDEIYYFKTDDRWIRINEVDDAQIWDTIDEYLANR